MTTKTEKSIDVDLPLDATYELWTQFEKFPEFMNNVEEVRVLSPDRLHWVAKITGVKREWDAAVTENIPNERIAWAATDGSTNAGAVTFHRIDERCTRVMLQLEFEPEGLIEQAGDKLGVVKSASEGDLEQFKKYAEKNATARPNALDTPATFDGRSLETKGQGIQV